MASHLRCKKFKLQKQTLKLIQSPIIDPTYVGDCLWAFNAKTTLEVSDSVIGFKKYICFTNSKHFCIANTSATTESDNENTCQQLAAETTPSLSFTTTPIPNLPPSMRPATSTLNL